MNESSNERSREALLIVFADITRFQINARRTEDEALAELLNAYYAAVTSLIAKTGGRVVKLIGDAVLAVWTEEHASRGAAGLIELKASVDAWWSSRGWDSRLVVKAHFGHPIAGPFGEDRRFDVIGNDVNIAATLPASTIALSPEAFRRLTPEDRKEWKKHTPQVVYIPVDDKRR